MSDSEPASQSTTGTSSSPSNNDVAPSVALSLTNSRFAFLNHSALTLPRNLPPNVDNKPLARQRRRRTSPEDAAILESEFQVNPKPNRSERARIAERVALGEKEVQIWFQNRRSTTRRRALPVTNPAYMDSLGANLPLDLGTTIPVVHDVTNTDNIPKTMEDSEMTLEANAGEKSETNIDSCSALTDNLTRLQHDTTGKGSCYTKTQTSGHMNIESQTSAHKLSQKRVAEDVTSLVTPTSLKRRPSGVRLSRTSDGGAQILGETESTPSRPRPSPSVQNLSLDEKQMPTLRRSSSTTDLRVLSSISQSSRRNVALRRQTSGRSRDSRAWEFWCDSDARQELSRKAEQDQAGSAISAISSMRSQPRAVLKASRQSDIWGADIPRGDDQHRAKKHKPSLQRAMSSIPSLGGVNAMVKQYKRLEGFDEESDKENRDPDGIYKKHAPRRTKLHEGKFPLVATLKESRTAPVANSHHRPLSMGTVKTAGFTSITGGITEDDDVRRFMRGEAVSGSKNEDDMDCIQGLLSLSQGNWR